MIILLNDIVIRGTTSSLSINSLILLICLAKIICITKNCYLFHKKPPFCYFEFVVILIITDFGGFFYFFHRIHVNHRVFSEYAKTGKGSMGWFYGFKLHLIINDKGEILSFCLTSGNVDDRNEAVMDSLTKEIFGKLFADRGYISQKLFEKLLEKDITLVTRAKKNMKNKLMDLYDRLMLRKRAVIESVNDFLKNICDIEHSRHRSVTNFLVNLVSALAAYSFLPKKPSVCSTPNMQEDFLCLLD